MDYVAAGGLNVARTLYDFVNQEAIPGSEVDAAVLWDNFGALIRELAPRNRALLDRRDALQRQVAAWHLPDRGKPVEAQEYGGFLRDIGYLQPDPADFSVGTSN